MIGDVKINFDGFLGVDDFWFLCDVKVSFFWFCKVGFENLCIFIFFLNKDFWYIFIVFLMVLYVLELFV